MKTQEQIIEEIKILKQLKYPFNDMISDVATKASIAGQVAALQWVVDYEYTGETEPK